MASDTGSSPGPFEGTLALGSGQREVDIRAFAGAGGRRHKSADGATTALFGVHPSMFLITV